MDKLQKRKRKNEKNDYSDKASFLRRKRLEKGLKLEEVSEGICSVSYLSRIEQNQVIVNDDYYRMLCEKLDVNYDDVVNKRDGHFYDELMKKYLQGKTMETHQLIMDMVAKNYYLDLEIELVVLFDNIIRGFYDDAKKGIANIEMISHHLVNSELVFFMYLIALYAYKTNQIKKTLQQIQVLQSIEFEEPFFALCIADISISTFYRLGCISKALNVYYDFITKAPVHLFSRQINIHKVETLVMTKLKPYEETKEIITEVLNSYKDDLEIREHCYYYLTMLYYQNDNVSDAIKTIISFPNSSRLMGALALCIIHQPNDYFKKEYLPIIDSYTFNRYDDVYFNYINYIKMKIDQQSPFALWNYLKSVFNKDFFFDYFIYTNEVKDFIELGIICGKNKETLRFIISLMDKIEYISIDFCK